MNKNLIWILAALTIGCNPNDQSKKPDPEIKPGIGITPNLHVDTVGWADNPAVVTRYLERFDSVNMVTYDYGDSVVEHIYSPDSIHTFYKGKKYVHRNR